MEPTRVGSDNLIMATRVVGVIQILNIPAEVSH